MNAFGVEFNITLSSECVREDICAFFGTIIETEKNKVLGEAGSLGPSAKLLAQWPCGLKYQLFFFFFLGFAFVM